MKLNISVETKVSSSIRAQQASAMFDVPPNEKCSLNWSGDFPIEERSWNVGLIVGPSGCGKSTIAKSVWPEEFAKKLSWGGASVVDDFDQRFSISDITNACSSVGFNTIPAWLRPFNVLSNGEQFRVEMARRVLEGGDLVVVDEFTSVVDRQVATVASDAIGKYIRKNNKKFVAVGCHFDVIEWLQPDWVLEPATMTFTWRSLRRRPIVEVEVKRVKRSLWRMFSKFHYLTAKLPSSAHCYGAFINGEPVGFFALSKFPHETVRNMFVVNRSVVLPDFQGLGISHAVLDRLGALAKAAGCRLRRFPAHPAYIRSTAKQKNWALMKAPGKKRIHAGRQRYTDSTLGIGEGRPCAVFEYIGEAIKSANDNPFCNDWK